MLIIVLKKFFCLSRDCFDLASCTSDEHFSGTRLHSARCVSEVTQRKKELVQFYLGADGVVKYRRLVRVRR